MGAAEKVCRRLVPAVVVAAGMSGSVGAGPAAAAQTMVVDCRSNPTALQTAIASASPGSTLLVRGRCTGPFSINKDLTLLGQGQAVLDGNHAGPTVTITASAHVRISALTITGGSTYAGGIFNDSSTVTVADSTVRNNNSVGNGGGIYVYFGTVTLLRSVVHGNSADSVGGGIYSDNGTVSLSSSTVRGNTASSGGGVFNDEGSNATLTDSVVNNNTATSGPGGGIYNNVGTVTLIHSTVRHNRPDNCAPTGSVPGCTG